jgi:hypothetical protein
MNMPIQSHRSLAVKRTFSFHPAGWPEGFQVEATFHPARPEQGENGFSLGQPAEDSYIEVEGINLNGKSVTTWADENLLLDREALAEEAGDYFREHIINQD